MFESLKKFFGFGTKQNDVVADEPDEPSKQWDIKILSATVVGEDEKELRQETGTDEGDNDAWSESHLSAGEDIYFRTYLVECEVDGQKEMYFCFNGNEIVNYVTLLTPTSNEFIQIFINELYEYFERKQSEISRNAYKEKALKLREALEKKKEESEFPPQTISDAVISEEVPDVKKVTVKEEVETPKKKGGRPPKKILN